MLNIHLNKCLHFVLWAFIYSSEQVDSPVHQNYKSGQFQLQGWSVNPQVHSMSCCSHGREAWNI